jgi:hypothetical protein
MTLSIFNIKAGQPTQDSQAKTARTGQDSYNRTARAGHPGQDVQAGQPGQYSETGEQGQNSQYIYIDTWDRTSVQGSGETTARTGQLGQDIRNRTA